MKIYFDAIQDLFPANLQPISKGQNKWFCPECRKTLDERMFFKTSRLNKFPNGILSKCKSCLTLKIDDTDPATFLPLLKEINVPYIPSEWRALLLKKEPHSGSIVGRYAGKMKLNQWKKFKWEDTEELVRIEEESILAALRNEDANISETDAAKRLEELTDLNSSVPQIAKNQIKVDQNIAAIYGLTPETSKYGLTAEEIANLKRIWGADYLEEEFYQMEELFNDMKSAYVLNDPIAISSARMIAKMTQKMNKLLNQDDIESAAKISRQLDLFIKSSNLAPQQQKDRSSSTYSISQLAQYLEKNGGAFKQEYFFDRPLDRIDELFLEFHKNIEQLVRGEPQIDELAKNQDAILLKYQLPQAQEDSSTFDDIFLEIEQEALGEGGEFNAVSDIDLE